VTTETVIISSDN